MSIGSNQPYSGAIPTLHTTADREFAFFDRLPPIVRKAIREAPVEIAAEDVFHAVGTPQTLACEVDRRTRIISGLITMEDYGPSHPQARHQEAGQ